MITKPPRRMNKYAVLALLLLVPIVVIAVVAVAIFGIEGPPDQDEMANRVASFIGMIYGFYMVSAFLIWRSKYLHREPESKE
jgi:arginine exporter protein ArgO